MDVALAHVAVGATAASNALNSNRALVHSTTADGSATCAAFAAKNSVALVVRDARTPSLLTIRAVLPHRGATREATRITSVYLHAPPSGEAPGRVVAGDSEGNVLLWTTGAMGEWKLQTLRGRDGANVTSDAVSAVTAVQTQRRWLYITAFSSGHVAVWQQLHGQDSEIQCIAVQSFGVRMIMETLAATTVSRGDDSKQEDDVLVAAGGVDSKVHLFEIARGTETFTRLLGLEGHRGWIRAVDFTTAADSKELLLASASQDHRVRLWTITTADAQSASSTGFQAAGASAVYTVRFDSLLIAHEDWVTSLVWSHLPSPTLVSTSMDNTVILWTKHATSGKWMPSLRVGEHGGNGVLATAVLPALDERTDLLVLSLSGQLDRWRQEPAPSKTFLPAPSLPGHTASVTDLAWSPRGDYVISFSLDQTTRVLAPWPANASWHEVSRAQVHGYDLNCGAFIPGSSTPMNDQFVSGADEKILRVFQAPDDLQTLVKAMKNEEIETDANASRIEHAYLPELSLTNKSTDKKADKKTSLVGSFATLDEADRIKLPVGDTLAKKTLWPEVRKLYGHGNELLCVTSNHVGTLVASACKSREEKFAALWLWRTSDWSALPNPLEGHKSSVVQLAFSPNDALLVSVSKDRHFCVFGLQADGSYALMDRVKAHKRIIWSCSWAPDSALLATGARDQTVAFWMKTDENKWTQRGESLVVDSAVTAVAFAPWAQDEDATKYLLAVGLESGAIYVYTVSPTPSSLECSLAATVPLELSPTATITRLAWSPTTRELACASVDHSVRLYRVEI